MSAYRIILNKQNNNMKRRGSFVQKPAQGRERERERVRHNMGTERTASLSIVKNNVSLVGLTNKRHALAVVANRWSRVHPNWWCRQQLKRGRREMCSLRLPTRCRCDFCCQHGTSRTTSNAIGETDEQQKKKKDDVDQVTVCRVPNCNTVQHFL